MDFEVALTKGKTAIIDEIDADITNRRWSATVRRGNRVYAILGVRCGVKTDIYYMHRIILERKIGRPLERGEWTDHINRNTLDNRRANLRLVTPAQNAMNSVKGSPILGTVPASSYKGVYYSRCGKKIKRWVAQIKIEGKWKWLGIFKTDIEAAKARDDAAKLLFGEFAFLNFPDGVQLDNINGVDNTATCPVCGYTWEKRVKDPKSCSRCKCRLDIPRNTQYLEKRLKSKVDLGLMPKFPVHVDSSGEIDGVGLPVGVLLEKPKGKKVKR
jgi:hypothetical protein